MLGEVEHHRPVSALQSLTSAPIAPSRPCSTILSSLITQLLGPGEPLALHCLWHQREGISAASSSPGVRVLMLVAARILSSSADTSDVADALIVVEQIDPVAARAVQQPAPVSWRKRLHDPGVGL